MGENCPVAEVVDAVGAKAIEIAHRALCEVVADDHIGEHLSVSGDDDRVVTHHFSCLDPGYRGWRWAVTVARPPRARSVTVDEIVLLPGPDSLLAPAWVPFGERVKPGDLGVGDVLPTPADDDRLVPGFAESDGEPDLGPPASGWEFGVGRARVLSSLGRDAASQRWSTGDHGPDTKMAKSAALSCGSCGFLVPLAGPLGRSFGVCANEFAPSDGVVVAMDYGCGAHSEIAVTALVAPPAPVLDELGYENVTAQVDAATPDEAVADESLDVAATPDPEPADLTTVAPPANVPAAPGLDSEPPESPAPASEAPEADPIPADTADLATSTTDDTEVPK